MLFTQYRLEENCKTRLLITSNLVVVSVFCQIVEKYVNAWIAVTAPFQGKRCCSTYLKILC